VAYNFCTTYIYFICTCLTIFVAFIHFGVTFDIFSLHISVRNFCADVYNVINYFTDDIV